MVKSTRWPYAVGSKSHCQHPSELLQWRVLLQTRQNNSCTLVAHRMLKTLQSTILMAEVNLEFFGLKLNIPSNTFF